MAKHFRQLKPLSAAAADDSMYHGGIVSVSGPFGEDDEKAANASDAFTDSIDRGMDALRNGTALFAADMEPVPNAPIEAFDIFDVATGQHHMIWRVACRERAKHAN